MKVGALLAPICIPPFSSPLWWLAPSPSPRKRGTMGAGQWCSFARGTVVKETHTTGLRPSEMHPYWCCAPLLLKGSMSLDFRVALLPYKSSSFATGGSVSLDSQSPKGSLRIQFPCHPGGGSFSGAMLCDAYEFIGFLRIVVPPHSGVAREHDS